jgi:hypothetical protein
MRMLITIGMVVIFISVFFIMLTIDSVIKNDMNCLASGEGKTVCNLDNMGFAFIIKMIVVGFFILIDIVTVYLIVTNVMPHGTYYMRGERGL